MKAIKITNAEWLPVIGKEIEDFTRKAHIDGIHGPNYYAFVARTVQYGGEAAEFWVVFDNDDPVGFGHWHVLDLPHIAKVYCHALNTWATAPKQKHKTIELLVDEFRKFGVKHNAVWYSADFINKTTKNTVEKYCNRLGYDVKESGVVNVIIRKKPI
jgi:hypothetical protein